MDIPNVFSTFALYELHLFVGDSIVVSRAYVVPNGIYNALIILRTLIQFLGCFVSLYALNMVINE